VLKGFPIVPNQSGVDQFPDKLKGFQGIIFAKHPMLCLDFSFSLSSKGNCSIQSAFFSLRAADKFSHANAISL